MRTAVHLSGHGSQVDVFSHSRLSGPRRGEQRGAEPSGGRQLPRRRHRHLFLPRLLRRRRPHPLFGQRCLGEQTIVLT